MTDSDRRPRRLGVRRVVAAALALAVAAAWAAPFDVSRLVAKQEPILLGRYSLGIFSGLALGSGVAWLCAALLWSRRTLAEVAGLLLIVLLSTTTGLAIVSAATRIGLAPRYLRAPVAERVADPALRARLAGDVMTRQPKLRWGVVRRDLPAPGRSYPNPAPGHPPVEVVLTTDDRGLRNGDRRGTYDVVVAGDSFTEGSMVDDDQTWWRQLGERTGLRVYNVAVSGLAPREYLNNFAAFGLDARPRIALFMVYEGNDFKEHRRASPPGLPRGGAARDGKQQGVLRRVAGWLYKDAPIRARAERALVGALAPIGAGRPLPPNPGLEWMPVAIPGGGAVRHYAFEPKHLLRLLREEDVFAASPEWTTNAEVFEEIAALAAEHGIRLVFVYAPVKPHVVLPLVRETVTAQQLRAFAALGADELPPANVFQRQVYELLDNQEAAMRGWCERRGVEFVSATAILRERMSRSVPVYFTYDPHWTEEGHAVVAELLADYLGDGAARAAQADAAPELAAEAPAR